MSRLHDISYYYKWLFLKTMREEREDKFNELIESKFVRPVHIEKGI